MIEFKFILFKEENRGNKVINKEDEYVRYFIPYIFDKEDEGKFTKAMTEESSDSMGILPDENLLFKATKVLKPYEGKNITLYLNNGPIASLVTVINVCHMLGISLTLAHYNSFTGYFDIQQVM